MSLPTVLQTKCKVFNDSSLHLRKTPNCLTVGYKMLHTLVPVCLSNFPTWHIPSRSPYPAMHVCECSVTSNSLQPHGLQTTRFLCPWDFASKNTIVGCHFLFQCRKVKRESEVAQKCLTPSDPMDCSLPGSSVHGIFQPRVPEWGAIAF